MGTRFSHSSHFVSSSCQPCEFARNSHAFNPIGGKTVMLAPGPAHRDGVFIWQRKRIGCV
jgi:hypothetical protein